MKPLALVLPVLVVATALPARAANPVVVVETSAGAFEVELYPDRAPKSVENFLAYAKGGHYDGTVFHRVVAGFMVQGGGFTTDYARKPTKDPIENEAANGLKNAKYTVAMARTRVVHSATAQFFVNVADNPHLDHTGKDPSTFGYAVFGKVISGTDVVDKIALTPTGACPGLPENCPTTPVVIKSVKLKDAGPKPTP